MTASGVFWIDCNPQVGSAMRDIIGW